MSDEAIDVLVVGAGPVGLFCANELVRHGLHCRIIDKKSQLSDKSKALGIHIRTLDVFQDCGLYDKIHEQGHVVHGACIKSKGKELASVTFAGIGANRDFLIDLPQDRTERVLNQVLTEKGRTVEWQSELINIEQQTDGVLASIKRENGETEQIKASWVIGCDGAHSTLRHLINAEFVGSSYTQTWWLADIHIKWALPEDKMIIYASENGPLACFPMGNSRYRLVLIAPVDSTNQPTLEDIIFAFQARSTDEAVLSDPIWITAFGIHHRQIQQYRHGRLFFAGDAAHIHSPMGGQGLNTGIQDTYNLIWKIALVQRGLAPESLLNSYHEERYPIGKEVLKKTHIMTKMILIKNAFLISLRNKMIQLLTSFDSLKKILAKDLAELKISYAKSSAVKKLGEKTGFKLGEFVPNLKLVNLKTDEKMSMEVISQGTMHHLFLFIGKETKQVNPLIETANALVEQYKSLMKVHLVLLDDKTGSENFASVWQDKNYLWHTQFNLNKPTALMVRPDKYIGLIQSPINLGELQNYLSRYFII